MVSVGEVVAVQVDDDVGLDRLAAETAVPSRVEGDARLRGRRSRLRPGNHTRLRRRRTPGLWRNRRWLVSGRPRVRVERATAVDHLIPPRLFIRAETRTSLT